MAFNLVGYKIVFIYLEEHAHLSMARHLDENSYAPETLTEIRVPLHLPYSLSDNSFERVDGSIVIEGRSYNYVERKMQNDTLILHCIPNKRADRIKQAYTEYGKNIQSPNKSQKENHFQILLKSSDWVNPATAALSLYAAIESKLPDTILTQMIADDKFTCSPEQPPDHA